MRGQRQWENLSSFWGTQSEHQAGRISPTELGSTELVRRSGLAVSLGPAFSSSTVLVTQPKPPYGHTHSSSAFMRWEKTCGGACVQVTDDSLSCVTDGGNNFDCFPDSVEIGI